MAVIVEQAPAARASQATACLWLLRLADWQQQVLQLQAFVRSVPVMWTEPRLAWTTVPGSAPKLACMEVRGAQQQQLCAPSQSVLGVEVCHVRLPATRVRDAQWSPDGSIVALLCEREVWLCEAATGVQRVCKVAFQLTRRCFSWAPCACHLLALPHSALYGAAHCLGTGGMLIDVGGRIVARSMQRCLALSVRQLQWSSSGTVGLLGHVGPAEPQMGEDRADFVWLCCLGGDPVCLQPLRQVAVSPLTRGPLFSPDGLWFVWLAYTIQKTSVALLRHQCVAVACVASGLIERFSAGTSEMPLGSLKFAAPLLCAALAGWSADGHQVHVACAAEAPLSASLQMSLWTLQRRT